MLTAKGDISDVVKGLDTGAEDYIIKPFAIEELLARIRVIQRKNMKKLNFNELIYEVVKESKLIAPNHLIFCNINEIINILGDYK